MCLIPDGLLKGLIGPLRNRLSSTVGDSFQCHPQDVFLPNGIEAPPTDHKVLTREEAKAKVKEMVAIVDRWMDSDAWVP